MQASNRRRGQFRIECAKESGLMGNAFTNEFQIFGVAWLNAVDENLVRAARDSGSLKKERSGRRC